MDSEKDDYEACVKYLHEAFKEFVEDFTEDYVMPNKIDSDIAFLSYQNAILIELAKSMAFQVANGKDKNRVIKYITESMIALISEMIVDMNKHVSNMKGQG